MGKPEVGSGICLVGLGGSGLLQQGDCLAPVPEVKAGNTQVEEHRGAARGQCQCGLEAGARRIEASGLEVFDAFGKMPAGLFLRFGVHGVFASGLRRRRAT